MISVTFTVPGDPRPKGSMTRYMRQSSRRVKGWQQLVGLLARQHIAEPLHGPMRVDLRFRFAVPARTSLGYPGRQVGDLDKLIRAVLDGLTGAAYADDAQVIEISAVKDFGEPGADVRVQALAPRWTTRGKCQRRGA